MLKRWSANRLAKYATFAAGGGTFFTALVIAAREYPNLGWVGKVTAPLAVVAATTSFLALLWSYFQRKKELKNQRLGKKTRMERFVKYLHERLFPANPYSSIPGLAPDKRISVLVPIENRKWLRLMYRSDGRSSKKLWSIDKENDNHKYESGLAGLAFTEETNFSLEGTDLPDCTNWKEASPEHKETFCEKTQVGPEVARELSWKARAYHAFPVKDASGVFGVMMFESKVNPGGLDKEIVGTKERLITDTNYLASLMQDKDEETA